MSSRQIIKKGKIRIKPPPARATCSDNIITNPEDISISVLEPIINNFENITLSAAATTFVTTSLNTIIPKWKQSPWTAAPRKVKDFSDIVPTWLLKPDGTDTITEHVDVNVNVNVIHANRCNWMLNGNVEHPAEIRTTIEGPGSNIYTDVDGWMDYVIRGGWVQWKTPGVNAWWGSRRDPSEWKSWSHTRARNPTWQNAVSWTLTQPYSFWHVEALGIESRVQWDISQSWVTDIQNDKGSIHFRIGANKSVLQLVEDNISLYAQKDIQLRCLSNFSLLSETFSVEIGKSIFCKSPEFHATHAHVDIQTDTLNYSLGVSHNYETAWEILSNNGNWNWKLNGGLFTMEIDPLWETSRKTGWIFKALDETSSWFLQVGVQTWLWDKNGQHWDLQGVLNYQNQMGSFQWSAHKFKWRSELPGGEMSWILDTNGTMLWKTGTNGKMSYEFTTENGNWSIIHPLFQYEIQRQKQFLSSKIPLEWKIGKEWLLHGNSLMWNFTDDVTIAADNTITIKTDNKIQLSGKTISFQFEKLEWLSDYAFEGYQRNGWSWISSHGNIVLTVGDHANGTSVRNTDEIIQYIELKTLNSNQPFRIRTEGEKSPIYIESSNAEVLIRTPEMVTEITSGKWFVELGESAKQVLWRINGLESEWRVEQHGSTIWNTYLDMGVEREQLVSSNFMFLDNNRIGCDCLLWKNHKEYSEKHLLWLTETTRPFGEILYNFGDSVHSTWKAHFGETIEWELHEEDASFRYTALEIGGNWYSGIYGEIRWDSLEGPFTINVQRGDINFLAGSKIYQETNGEEGWESRVNKGNMKQICKVGRWFSSAQQGFVQSTPAGYYWAIHREPFDFEAKTLSGFEWVWDNVNGSIWDHEGWKINLNRQFWQVTFSDSQFKLSEDGFFWKKLNDNNCFISYRVNGEYQICGKGFVGYWETGKISYSDNMCHTWTENGDQSFILRNNRVCSDFIKTVHHSNYQNSECRLTFEGEKSVWLIESNTEQPKWIIQWNGPIEWTLKKQTLEIEEQTNLFQTLQINIQQNLSFCSNQYKWYISRQQWTEEKGDATSTWDADGNWTYSTPGAGTLFWPVSSTPIQWKIDSHMSILLNGNHSSFSVESSGINNDNQFIVFKFNNAHSIWKFDSSGGFLTKFGDWEETRDKNGWFLESTAEYDLNWRFDNGMNWRIVQDKGGSFRWKSEEYELEWSSRGIRWETPVQIFKIGGEQPGLIWSHRDGVYWELTHESCSYISECSIGTYVVQVPNYLFYIGNNPDCVQQKWLIESSSNGQSVIESWKNTNYKIYGIGASSWELALEDGEIKISSAHYRHVGNDMVWNSSGNIYWRSGESMEWETDRSMTWKSNKKTQMKWELMHGGSWKWEGSPNTQFQIQAGGIFQTVIEKNYDYLKTDWRNSDAPQFIWDVIAQAKSLCSPGIFIDSVENAPILTATVGLYGVHAKHILMEVMEDYMIQMCNNGKNQWGIFTGSWQNPDNAIFWKPNTGHFEWKHGNAIGHWELISGDRFDILSWKTQRESPMLQVHSFATSGIELRQNIISSRNDDDILILRGREIVIDGKLSIRDIGFDWLQGGCGIRASPGIKEWIVDAPSVFMKKLYFRGDENQETSIIEAGNVEIKRSYDKNSPLLSVVENSKSNEISSLILKNTTFDDVLSTVINDDTICAALCVATTKPNLAGLFVGDVRVIGTHVVRGNLIVENCLLHKLSALDEYNIYPVDGKQILEEIDLKTVVDLVDAKGDHFREILDENNEKITETVDLWELVSTLWSAVQTLRKEIAILQTSKQP